VRTLTRHKWIAAVLAATSILGTGLAVAQTGKSTPRQPESFAALRTLPAPANVPAPVADFIERVAPVMGANATALQTRARELRQGLGGRARSVWAFTDERGRPCYFATDSGGGCATLDNVNPTGLHWSIGAGYPDEPAPFIALADDQITSVTLQVDGADISVSLKNNVAYAVYPNTARQAVITAHYSDGTAQSQTVSLEG
jgi:hypothetical protein